MKSRSVFRRCYHLRVDVSRIDIEVAMMERCMEVYGAIDITCTEILDVVVYQRVSRSPVSHPPRLPLSVNVAPYLFKVIRQ